WWTSRAWRAALWRPLTAFTHWLDYRLYPKTPWLMHAHNIAWFAVAAFLTATMYRRIAFTTTAVDSSDMNSGELRGIGPAMSAAGLAACLWLLDKNTYFP